LSVKLVAAADKYHNLSHTLQNLRSDGSSVWKRFGRGPEQQAWYYRTVLVSILTNIPEPVPYPIFGQLSDIIDELFEGIPSKAP
jgi:hypothetical protein